MLNVQKFACPLRFRCSAVLLSSAVRFDPILEQVPDSRVPIRRTLLQVRRPRSGKPLTALCDATMRYVFLAMTARPSARIRRTNHFGGLEQ